ncbi:hypothetical protein [Tardiphaga sp. P9-11]|uniref:hypothetical protein n=1 Tax=Tardiphaga sp. P9-11 TaxID=2024614 RepID=UPI0011F1FD77|nr:hypothetical protein [Tardiphaga sp. P9-11]
MTKNRSFPLEAVARIHHCRRRFMEEVRHDKGKSAVTPVWLLTFTIGFFDLCAYDVKMGFRKRC